jgi:hypothetical protein
MYKRKDSKLIISQRVLMLELNRRCVVEIEDDVKNRLRGLTKIGCTVVEERQGRCQWRQGSGLKAKEATT